MWFVFLMSRRPPRSTLPHSFPTRRSSDLMVNGAAYAALDRAPLIMITDRYSTPAHEVGLRQRIDQLAIYGPLMKWSTTIDARTVRQQLRRAMRTATARPPGPVPFDMPQRDRKSVGEGQSW